jgi:hypothetical protein
MTEQPTARASAPPRGKTRTATAGSGKKILGLPRIYVIGGGIAIAAGIAWYLYKQHKASSATTATSTTQGSPCTASDGTAGSYDANGNCVSATTSGGTDDSGELSVLQSELEALLAQQGTSSTGSTATTTGSTNVTVPNVVGQEAGTAHNTLAAAGLKPTAISSQIPTDIVTSTSPAAGASVAAGSEVTIIASATGGGAGAAANEATVPRLTKGENAGQMHNAIVAAGLVPAAAAGQKPSWIVKSTSPAGGTQVPRGSRVVINATGK